MTSKELNKLYEKAKAEYLAEIQNDDGSYTCKGCGHDFMTIEIHHILKRRFKYYFADKRNFMELCHENECHTKAEGTVEMQKMLDCYDEIDHKREILLMEYAGLELYEQTLLYKYGK